MCVCVCNYIHTYIYSRYANIFFLLFNYISGASEWLSQLSVWLPLRSWSHGLWVRAPRRALCRQLREPTLDSVSVFLCPSLACARSLSLSLSLSQIYINIKKNKGAPGWLSRLSIWIRLRSWSHSSWVQALRGAQWWQLRAWSLLQILCLSAARCPTPPRLCLCLSLKNKH